MARMPLKIAVCVLLLGLAPLVWAEDAKTDTQVKAKVDSKPSGMTVWLDGHQAGKTPCTLDIPADRHVVEVKGDGYKPWRQVVSGDAAQPQALTAEMEAETPLDAPAKMPDADAIIKAIPKDTLGTLATAVSKELAAHPSDSGEGTTLWLGVAGEEVYAIALHRLPAGQMANRAASPMGEAVRARASSELFLTTELLHQAQESGLDDLTCLRRACGRMAGESAWSNHTDDLKSVGVRCGDWMVGFARAPRKSVAAKTDFDVNRNALELAYAREVSKVADALLAQKKPDDALALYYHLHARQLASRWNYLRVAQCFRDAGHKDDALKVIKKVYADNHTVAGVDWLEACGDLASSLEPNSALAANAYEEATQRILKSN